MDPKQSLRLEALKLASRERDTASEIVANARTFLEFLEGKEDEGYRYWRLSNMNIWYRAKVSEGPYAPLERAAGERRWTRDYDPSNPQNASQIGRELDYRVVSVGEVPSALRDRD